MLRSAQSTIRNAAVSAVMAAAAVAITGSASAEEVRTAANASANCAERYTPDTRDVGCAAERFIERMDKESAEARARGEAARKRAEQARREGEQVRKQNTELERRVIEADRVNVCLDYLKNLVVTEAKDGKTGEPITKATIREKAGGKITDQNACPVAAEFGYGRRAEAPAPSLN